MENPENANTNETTAALSPSTSEPVAQADGDSTAAAPRLLAGLQSGRIVNYVMASGAIRPLLVLAALLEVGNPVDGILFFSRFDRGDMPVPLLADESGHPPSCSVCIAGAKFDDTGVVPGTWHWPTKQAVMAAGVDTNAINTIVAAMMEPVAQRIQDNLSELLDAKLEATLKTVNELLDSHSQLVTDAVAQVKHPVLTEAADPQGTDSPNPAPAGETSGAPTGADLDANAADQAAASGEPAKTATAGS